MEVDVAHSTMHSARSGHAGIHCCCAAQGMNSVLYMFRAVSLGASGISVL